MKRLRNAGSGKEIKNDKRLYVKENRKERNKRKKKLLKNDN